MNLLSYTDQEKEILKKYYPEHGSVGVKKYINRSGDSIRHTAKKLGIKCKEGFWLL